MQYVDEFRDPQLARALLRRIAARLEALARPLQIMEFCGGHTHAIFRHGLQQLLPEGIEFVHGPGCPVCVLPTARVDECIAVAQQPGVIVASFGDALRVPGTRLSLQQAAAAGADIRMVYSPLDALDLARRNPEREVVFFALGFETTMPATALTVLQARREDIGNFSLLCNHVATVPTLKAVLDDPELRLDGFIAPGHVAMVIGASAFEFVARDYQRPIVVTGFEPLDILQALEMLVAQIAAGRHAVENQYARVVGAAGNRVALAAIDAVFETSPDAAGVRIRDACAGFDAARRFALPALAPGQMAGTTPGACAAVLRGALRPWQCPAYGKECRPETPLGALMVSSEGACAAYFNHAPAAARVAS
jgi:hydrogenase expression/formation protein HypD